MGPLAPTGPWAPAVPAAPAAPAGPVAPTSPLAPFADMAATVSGSTSAVLREPSFTCAVVTALEAMSLPVYFVAA